MLSRRKMIAGAAAFPMAIPAVNSAAQSATPMATPAASPVASTAPTTDDILPAWLDAQDALRQLGEGITDAYWNGDTDAIINAATPELAVSFQGDFTLEELTNAYTQNQILFRFNEANAWFFGQYTPEGISGMFSQSGPLPWEAVPDEEQTGEVPTGSWTGIVGPGILNLEIALEFSGDADSLEVLLSIPSQLLASHPMTDVEFAEEIPIGEIVDTRVIPAGGDVTIDFYSEQYEWGNHTLVLQTAWSPEGDLAGFMIFPQGTLPDVEEQEPIIARLPFDGAWMVFWGGETEFQNYHAATPPQRYAVDIMVWQDGSTSTPPGTDNEHYHTFGQPYLAPVDGTIAAAQDGLDDIPPQQPGSNPEDSPVGNHVVIETQGGFVFLAHCQKGSISVNEGDTVSAGDVVAAVGNSGNTSESHVHIHAQSHADIFDPQAVGIPIVFENALENGEPVDQLSPLHGTIVEHRS